MLLRSYQVHAKRSELMPEPFPRQTCTSSHQLMTAHLRHWSEEDSCVPSHGLSPFHLPVALRANAWYVPYACLVSCLA